MNLSSTSTAIVSMTSTASNSGVGGGLVCFALNFSEVLIFLTSVMALEAIVVFGLIARSWYFVRHGNYSKGGALIFPIYNWYLAAFMLSVFLRSFGLGFLPKDTKLWQLIQMVISDAWDAFFRDGICIFFAFSGVGTYEVQRMRAVSALWAMAIMALGLWQYIYTNPAAVPYYGGTFTYWLTHDIAGACLHLTLLLLYLRPGFTRRQAKAWILSLLLFIIYILYIVTTVLELWHPGHHEGDCLSIITQAITYLLLPLVAYFAMKWDSAFWRNMGRRPPRRIRRKGASEPLLEAGDVDIVDFDSVVIDFTQVTVDKMIGEGGTARVFVGKFKEQTVAIKHFYAAVSITTTVMRDLAREIELSLQLRHPNIVQVFGISLMVPNLAIILEFMARGSLFDVLREARRRPGSNLLGDVSLQRAVDPRHRELVFLPYDVKLHMCLDITKALNFMHSQEPIILHLDLKSLNVLVSSNWTLKLSDFGESRLVDATGYVTGTPGRGTTHWMAPEVIRNAHYSVYSDVYSLGMCFYEIMTARQPFEDMDTWKIGYEVIEYAKRPDLPEISDYCPEAFHEMVLTTWKSEPKDRCDTAELLKLICQELERVTGQDFSKESMEKDDNKNEIKDSSLDSFGKGKE